jgi:hypothetical protein
VKKPAATVTLAALLLASPVLAADPPAILICQVPRRLYLGDGLTYVVMKGDKGERIYRYGDASRLTAKKDTRGYMLFTCASPHVFLQQKPEDKAVLMKARVVKAGEPEFADLDAKYLAGCKNPLVKSAVPKAK